MRLSRALDRKLLRETLRLKGQIATIAIVLAAGMASFLALRGATTSLEDARDAYYDRCRFAHVFARVNRAPETLVRRIESLPGVAAVQTRIAEEVTLPIEGMSRPAWGRLLSLPSTGTTATNDVVVTTGRLPRRAAEDEVAVLASFAERHGLQPGHRLHVVVEGKLRRLRVVGLVLSPEFVYAIRPGAIVDDPRRYAVLWMDRSTLATVFQLDGSFNDVSLRLQPGASESATREALDEILRPYGTDGSVDRAHQLSNRILGDELGQLGSIAGMVPVVFLGVAAFLINMVLGRLVALQRPEIAALKALGYTNGEIRRHYLGLVAVVMAPGTVAGIVGGLLLGGVLVDLYASIFRFPELRFRMSAELVFIATIASAIAAVGGALLAIRGATRLPPAEAMRPAAPSAYGRGLFDRLRLARWLGPSGMMVVRELARRPLRTLLSSVGMAAAIALLVLGNFAVDSIDAHFDGVVRREHRQDLSVGLLHPASHRAVSELAHVRGVLGAEGLRSVPVRVRFEHRTRETMLVGLGERALLRHVVDRGTIREVTVPDDGVLVTNVLAEVLGFRIGDRIELEIREGERPVVRPLVVGLVDEATGMQLYARTSYVARLEGDRGAVSTVLLAVDPTQRAAVEDRLRRSPRVVDVGDLREDIARLRAMNADALNVWSLVSIALSACVVFGVVYNNARISLATRSRDLASLRVLGLSRSEISWILVGGLAIEVVLAIPLGLFLGHVWSRLFMGMLDREAFRWTVFITSRTYALATTVAVVSAAASALWVRRSVDRLDLIGVLKTRE